MKLMVTYLLLVFLGFLTFAHTQSLSFIEGRVEKQCVSCTVHKVTKQQKVKHHCCEKKVVDTSETTSENCGHGTYKMSCCALFLAVFPVQFEFNVLKKYFQKKYYAVKLLFAFYFGNILHPPILSL